MLKLLHVKDTYPLLHENYIFIICAFLGEYSTEDAYYG
jgi:hypothetical protein